MTKGLLRACAVWLVWSAGVFAACTPEKVDLRGPFGETMFAVEIADTDATRARGLMFRQSLADDAGMLFVYPQPARLSFWMRNTFIELDLLFLNENGVVQHIHHRAQPHDETPIHGGTGVAVLEIAGGRAKELGLAVGDVMRHPFFDSSKAAWPC